MKILLFTDPHYTPNLHQILYSMERKSWYLDFVHKNISFQALLTFIS